MRSNKISNKREKGLNYPKKSQIIRAKHRKIIKISRKSYSK